jgi:hypothetical protein
MKASEAIDLLTYRSWWYQINWYGMEIKKARKLFQDWKRYEEIYKNEKKD